MGQRLSEHWVKVQWQERAAQQPVVLIGMKEKSGCNPVHSTATNVWPEVNNNIGTVFSIETHWTAAAESPLYLFLGDSFPIQLLHILSLWLWHITLENTLIFLWKRILLAVPAGFVWADGTNKKGACIAAYTPQRPQKITYLVEYACPYIYLGLKHGRWSSGKTQGSTVEIHFCILIWACRGWGSNLLTKWCQLQLWNHTRRIVQHGCSHRPRMIMVLVKIIRTTQACHCFSWVLLLFCSTR